MGHPSKNFLGRSTSPQKQIFWLINNQSPSNGGSIRIDNPTIYNIVNGTLSLTAGWIVLAVGLVYVVQGGPNDAEAEHSAGVEGD